MSYGDLAAGTAPAITSAFSKYLSDARSFATISGTLWEGISLAKEPAQIAGAVETMRAASEMLYSKVGDNFQTYITELLLLIYDRHPHAFYKRKYEARLAFEANNLESLKRSIVEEQVGDLSYRSLPDLNTFVKDTTGFDVFPNQAALFRTYKIMNIRNVITHNRGIANELFLSRDKSRKDVVGQKVKVPNFHRANRYLTILARDIDLRACEKFGFNADVLHFRKGYSA